MCSQFDCFPLLVSPYHRYSGRRSYVSTDDMKPFLMSICAASLVVVSIPTGSEAFSARHGTRVNPVDGVVFEVVPKGSGLSNEIWCGAAEYARRGLGAAWTDRIYVSRGRGESVTTGRRSAVQFTLDPNGAGVIPSENWLQIGFSVGNNMTIRQATEFCFVVREEL